MCAFLLFSINLLFLFYSGTVFVEHSEFRCTRTMTIRGYSILFCSNLWTLAWCMMGAGGRRLAVCPQPFIIPFPPFLCFHLFLIPSIFILLYVRVCCTSSLPRCPQTIRVHPRTSTSVTHQQSPPESIPDHQSTAESHKTQRSPSKTQSNTCQISGHQSNPDEQNQTFSVIGLQFCYYSPPSHSLHMKSKWNSMFDKIWVCELSQDCHHHLLVHAFTWQSEDPDLKHRSLGDFHQEGLT